MSGGPDQHSDQRLMLLSRGGRGRCLLPRLKASPLRRAVTKLLESQKCPHKARPRRAAQFARGRTADGRFGEGWAKYAQPFESHTQGAQAPCSLPPGNKKAAQGRLIFCFLAEAVRFELTNGSHRRQFSRLLPSTTRPRFLILALYRSFPMPNSTSAFRAK